MKAKEIYEGKPYDQSVDIFALGCVVYFLVRFQLQK